nr:hypothetical protein [Tanacetum cinerariifolium]
MTLEAIKELIIQRVSEALAIKEANRNLRPIIEGESENRDDNGKGNGGGNGNGNGGGNENGNDGGNGNDSQVKFSTYTLLDCALIWWDSHVKTIRIDEAYEMSQKE